MRPRRPSVVWAALAALGMAALGGVGTLAGTAWQVADLRAQGVGHGDLDVTIVGMAPVVVLVVVAALLVAAGRGAGRGLAWVAAAYSVVPLNVVIVISPEPVDYVTLTKSAGDAPSVASTLQVVGCVVVLIALLMASVLLALPDARRYALSRAPDAPGSDRRPRALAGATAAAVVGTVGCALAALAYMTATIVLPADVGYEGLVAIIWVFAFLCLLVVTAFAVTAVAFVVVTLWRKRWARRTTLLVAIVPLAAAAPAGYLAVASATTSPGADHPHLVALFVAGTVGGAMALAGFSAVVVLLSLSTVTAWVDGGRPLPAAR